MAKVRYNQSVNFKRIFLRLKKMISGFFHKPEEEPKKEIHIHYRRIEPPLEFKVSKQILLPPEPKKRIITLDKFKTNGVGSTEGLILPKDVVNGESVEVKIFGSMITFDRTTYEIYRKWWLVEDGWIIWVNEKGICLGKRGKE